MSKIGTLKTHLQRWGWVRTIYSLIIRVAEKVLSLHILKVRTRLTTERTGNPCQIPDIEFRRIDAPTLVDSTDDPELELDRAFVDKALERGDVAFGAFHGSFLVAYVWRSMTSAPHADGLWVRVRPPFCYCYKSFTRPEYRGKGIVPTLILWSDREMLKSGYTRRAGFIEVHNFSSLAFGDRIDSDLIGLVGYVDWFGHHFVFRSKSVARIGFELFEREGDGR